MSWLIFGGTLAEHYRSCSEAWRKLCAPLAQAVSEAHPPDRPSRARDNRARARALRLEWQVFSHRVEKRRVRSVKDQRAVLIADALEDGIDR